MDKTARDTRFEEISDKINNLSEEEQKFTLWLLLDRYATEMTQEANNKRNPTNVSELYALQKMSEHIKAANEIYEVIGLELF